MRVIEPPHLTVIDDRSVFLAGSIEMGAAERWQDVVVSSLMPYDGIIFNPRRYDWDSSWKQEISDKNFHSQVVWELEMIEKADVVAFYFDPKTKSPITLLELGLCAQKKHTIVCCPEGFWRKGNVDIVCRHHRVQQAQNLNHLINLIKDTL